MHATSPGAGSTEGSLPMNNRKVSLPTKMSAIESGLRGDLSGYDSVHGSV